LTRLGVVDVVGVVMAEAGSFMLQSAR